MKVLISGGCKNGKSAFAEREAMRLAAGGPLYYVATMIPFDEEDRARIRKHIAERSGKGFVTVEQPRNIAACLEKAEPEGCFLIDSLTALLLNEQYPHSFMDPPDPGAPERCREGLLQIVRRAEHAVFVTDYIYSDAARYSRETEAFREALAFLDKALAEVCDQVIELCAGNVVYHKGGHGA